MNMHATDIDRPQTALSGTVLSRRATMGGLLALAAASGWTQGVTQLPFGCREPHGNRAGSE